MASVKLIKQIMEIIDPETASLSKKKAEFEELNSKEKEEYNNLYADVEDIIEAVEEHNATTKRLFIVGQIQYDGSEEVHTVALGPYGARGVLSDQEKFDKAAEGSTAAHEAGGKLAWDTRTGKGRGRYMVVPVFRTARDAWDFHRASVDSDPDELIEHVTAALEAAPVEIVPSCTCGIRPESGHQNVMGVRVTRKCYRHLEK